MNIFYLVMGFVFGKVNVQFLVFFVNNGSLRDNCNILTKSYKSLLLQFAFPIFSSFYFYFFLSKSLKFAPYIILLIYMSFILSFGNIISFYVIPELFWSYCLIIFILFISESRVSFRKCIAAFIFYLCACFINHLFNNKLGMGDIKLFALWFLTIGFVPTLSSNLISSLLGIIFILFSGHPKHQAIPFVPFLSLGLIISTIFY